MEEEIAALVACSESKQDDRTIAWQLYNSTLFQKSWTAATVVGTPFVMSGKHGLVRATERLDHYDEYLGDKDAAEKRLWAEGVLDDLPSQYDTVVLFGGRDYVEPIKKITPTYPRRDLTVYDPYLQTSGNGQQMRVADEIAERAYESRVEGSPTAAEYVINTVCEQ